MTMLNACKKFTIILLLYVVHLSRLLNVEVDKNKVRLKNLNFGLKVK